MSLLDFTLIALATFYSSYAVASTHGPFGLFTLLREKAPLGGLSACMICLSPWFSLLFYLVMLIAPPVVWIFAAAGVSVFLFRWTGGAVL